MTVPEMLTAHTLRGEGFDASEDGTGRGIPLMPARASSPAGPPEPFDHFAETVGETSGRGPAGDEAQNLVPVVMAPFFSKRPGQQIATGGPSRITVPAIYRKSKRAQTSEDDETWVEAEVANTLNCFDQGDVRATEVVVEAVGLELRQDPGTSGEVSAPLGAADKGPGVAIGVDVYNGALTGEVAATMVTSTGSGVGPQVMEPHPAGDMAVRRLTPVECERLQGFPDGYTLVPRPPGAKRVGDGVRYKALGNSMARVVMLWIGRRVVAVEKALAEVSRV